MYGTSLFAQTAVWQIRPTYDSVEIISENMIAVEKDGLFGICSYDGTTVVECRNDAITQFKDNYALLIQNGAVKGNVSLSGKVKMFDKNYLVDMDYPYYSEGLLAVKSNGRWGYVDTEGNTVIDCRFRNALPFMKGLASVSDAEGNFMHINKAGKISLLGSGFNDDDLKFATSFMTDDKGEPFSIVINSRWKAYKRDLSGKKTGNFELADVVVDTRRRTMESGEHVLYFDPAWRLLRLDFQGNPQKEYVVGDQFSSEYVPAPSVLEPVENSTGEFGIKLHDRICLPEQFEHVVPLDDERVLVSTDGLFGLLKIKSDEAIAVGLDSRSVTLNHHTECGLNGFVRLPNSLSGKKVEITSIIYNDVNIPIKEQSSTSFSFNYLPDDLKTGHRQDFYIKVKVDGLEYPTFCESADFAHRSSFRVSAPDKVSLDENGSCRFHIYITNDSGQKSDRCEIYVDGILVKTQESFSGGQRISAIVSKRINIEDEDLKTKTLDIRIVEKGCPEYVVGKKVIFERYYANN